MADQLLRSSTQAAEGPLVLDGETLIGIVVKDTYTFSASHQFASEVTAYEVEPASEESRLTADAAVTLDDAEVAWLVLISGSTALDLSDVDDRGGIVWVRPGATDADRQIVGFAADPGDANAAYLPTWPDGLYAEEIAPIETSGADFTVAGVAAVDGDVPAEELADAIEAYLEGGGGSGDGLVLTGFDAILAADAIDGSGDEFEGLVLHPSDAGAGIRPAGWALSPGASFDASSLAGVLGFVYPDGVNALVYTGGSWSLRFVTAATVGDPWPEVAGNVLSGGNSGGLRLRANLVDGELVLLNGSEAEGVFANQGSSGEVLKFIEGKYADATRHVGTYFEGAVPDLSTLMADAVADEDQPIGDDGEQVQKGDFVATLGDAFWIHYVHPTTGQWARVPSVGSATPSDAGSWPGALTTNALESGARFVCRRSGVIGTWMGYRTGTLVTGQPAAATRPTTTGEWALTVPAGAVTPSDIGAVPTTRLLAGLDLTADRSADDLLTALGIALDQLPTTVYPATTLSVTSSTTLVDATGLGFPVVSGKRYTIDGLLVATGVDTGDIKLACTHPGGTMAVQFTGHLISVTAAGTNQAQQQAPLDTSGASQNWGLTTTGNVGLPFKGTFIASATGTFQLQFAQRVSDSTATSLLTTSYLTYRITP